MGSVTNWNERCYRCRNETRFHHSEYKSGEGYDDCSVCGASVMAYMRRDLNGKIDYKRMRIALSNIKVRFIHLYTKKTIAEFRLPKTISIVHPERINFFTAQEWVDFMKQFGVEIQADLEHAFVCLYFRTKGKMKRWERFNYVGNWLEDVSGRETRHVYLCRAKWDVRRNKGYGVMCISYKGNREPYYRKFKSVPNIPHILRKWKRMTGTTHDPEHSYLTVIDGDKLVFLKGNLRCSEEEYEPAEKAEQYPA